MVSLENSNSMAVVCNPGMIRDKAIKGWGMRKSCCKFCFLTEAEREAINSNRTGLLVLCSHITGCIVTSE